MAGFSPSDSNSSPRSTVSRDGTDASSQSSGTQLEWMEVEAVPDIHVASPASKVDVDLHFVSETGVARPRGSLRDLIRSQARRKLKHRNGPTQIKRSKVSNEVNDATHVERIQETRQTEQRAQKSPKAQPLIKSESPETTASTFPRMKCPDGNAHDPFDSLVISKRGRSHFYIKHYFLTFKHTYPSDVMTTKQKKNTAMAHAFRDPAFLHATLFHSALNLCRVHGTSFSRDVFYHHGESIRIINQRLKDPNFRQVSDITILTVACLIHFEILADYGFNGVKNGMDKQEAKVHMDGLEAMINGRGGLKKVSVEFSSGKSTSTFVGWADTCICVALNTKPHFELVQSEREMGDDEWSEDNGLAQRYKRKLFNLTGHEILSTNAIGIYTTLRHVPPLPEDEAFELIKNGEPARVYQYKGQLERLERRSLALIQMAQEPSSRNLQVYELFGNAALIHALLFMRDSPGSIPLVRLLSTRLRKTLEESKVANLLLQYSEMILWVLIMGGLGGIGTQNQRWFASLLAKTCLALGLVGRDEVSSTVAEFLWYDQYAASTKMAFWDDVDAAQGLQERSVVVLPPPQR